jgi:hypothetical protein
MDYDDITDARCASYWDNIEMPKERTMEKPKIEIFLYTKDKGTRVSVSEWDDDCVWISMIGNNSTMWVTLSHDEAEQMITALQMALKKNVD